MRECRGRKSVGPLHRERQEPTQRAPPRHRERESDIRERKRCSLTQGAPRPETRAPGPNTESAGPRRGQRQGPTQRGAGERRGPTQIPTQTARERRAWSSGARHRVRESAGARHRSLCVGARRSLCQSSLLSRPSLCRGPALSVSGAGVGLALFHSLCLGPALCVGARRSLALCVGARRSLCRGPALSRSPPDDPRKRPSMVLTSMRLAFASHSICLSKHACTIEILLIKCW